MTNQQNDTDLGIPAPATEAVDPPTQAGPTLLAWGQETKRAPEVIRPWREVMSRAALIVWIGVVVAAIVGLLGWWASVDTTPPDIIKPGTAASGIFPGASVTASTTPEAATTTSAMTPPSAPANPYTPLVGHWRGHHRWLIATDDGSIEMEIPDYPACPTCAAVMMPSATVHIGLTSYDANGDGKFFGYVKDSADTSVVPKGVPVEVDVEPAGDWQNRNGARWADGRPAATGRVMTVSIQGLASDNRNAQPLGDKSPFCDETALDQSVCGA